jgi:hypothetical protein
LRREASREHWSSGSGGAGGVTRQRATDATVKAEVLRLAEEHGAAEAAKRTGVPAATIRCWRHRSGASGPPKSVDPQTWAERKRAGAEEAWAAAQEALAQVRSLLVVGKTADAQRAALTMAILTDKSGVLEEAARREEERQVRIAEGQAQLIAEVVRMYFEAVGLTLGPTDPRPAAPPGQGWRTTVAAGRGGEREARDSRAAGDAAWRPAAADVAAGGGNGPPPGLPLASVDVGG